MTVSIIRVKIKGSVWMGLTRFNVTVTQTIRAASARSKKIFVYKINAETMAPVYRFLERLGPVSHTISPSGLFALNYQ